jgi:hypothetical protein
MGWHTTYFAVLYNFTGTPWNVVDLEDPGWGTIIVGSKTFRHMGGQRFPWCSGAAEIRAKAFRFNAGGDMTSGGGTTEFFLFQDYASRTVSWLPVGGDAQPRLDVVAESVNVYLNAVDDGGRWDGQVEVVRST